MSKHNRTTSNGESGLVQLVTTLSVEDSPRRSRRSSPSTMKLSASITSTSNEGEDVVRAVFTLETTISHPSLISRKPATPPSKCSLSNGIRSVSSQSAPDHRIRGKGTSCQRSVSASNSPARNCRSSSLVKEEPTSCSAALKSMRLGVSPNPGRKNAPQPHVEEFDDSDEVFDIPDDGAADTPDEKVVKYADEEAEAAGSSAEVVYKFAADTYTSSGCRQRLSSPLDGNAEGQRGNIHYYVDEYVNNELPKLTRAKLEKMMKTALSRKEKETDGYIYVIQIQNPVSSNLTHLKVGSSEDPVKRVGYWQNHYKNDNPELRGLTSGRKIFRLEKLIHIELMDIAIPMLEPTSMTKKPCTHCNVKHREIFSFKTDTYETVVEPLIRKWTKFVEEFYK
ncbi:hypothetical protein BD410DRAFT_807233 [Rickenella mellea]|uniref:Bacteriophage T5 Orf172 DNA-binding domain-containing protein n=1 Tax=Rickenella mellea TaxID=50990 RepID=A0A4Y7PRM2_9AGAM|nr:hypothetical protein BD410DRAFT_807233 [Rickenella mellea]